MRTVSAMPIVRSYYCNTPRAALQLVEADFRASLFRKRDNNDVVGAMVAHTIAAPVGHRFLLFGGQDR